MKCLSLFYLWITQWQDSYEFYTLGATYVYHVLYLTTTWSMLHHFFYLIFKSEYNVYWTRAWSNCIFHKLRDVILVYVGRLRFDRPIETGIAYALLHVHLHCNCSYFCQNFVSSFTNMEALLHVHGIWNDLLPTYPVSEHEHLKQLCRRSLNWNHVKKTI